MRLLGGFVQLSTRLHLARINDSLSVEMEEKTAGHPWEFFVEIKRPDRYRSLYEIRAPNLKSENFLPGGAEIFRQFFVFFWPRFKWVVEQTSAWNGPVHWRSGAEHVRLLFSPRKKRSSDPIEWDRPPCNQNPGTHTLEPQKKKVFIYTSHKGTRHQSEAGRTSRDLEMEIFGRQKIKGFPGTRVPVGQKKTRGSHYQTKFPCSSALEHEIFLSFFRGPKVGVSLVCLFLCCSVNRMSLLFTFFSASPQRTFRAPDGSLSSSFRQIVLN